VPGAGRGGVLAGLPAGQVQARRKIRRVCTSSFPGPPSYAGGGRGTGPGPLPARCGNVCEAVVMPWIDLEGAVNARDLGGLPGEDGRQTLGGRLLRSDNLQDLSPADVAKLVHEIGVTTVVDLRSSAEVESEGPAPLDSVPEVRHAHHPVIPELGSATDAIAEALLTRIQRDKSRFPDDPTCGHYLGYLEDRPDQVVAALQTVARAPGAALVHCAAGKDRTGVVVALALTAAGVRPEAVVADYGATGDRIEAILGRLRKSRTYAKDIDSQPVVAHLARPETMAAFLEQMDASYGGVVPWLADHGFGDEDLRLLRVKLFLPQDGRSAAIPKEPREP